MIIQTEFDKRVRHNTELFNKQSPDESLPLVSDSLASIVNDFFKNRLSYPAPFFVIIPNIPHIIFFLNSRC